MRRRIVILFIIILTSSSTLVLLPIKAQYQGSITINSDGSISPQTAPIEQTGNVYSVINNTVESITVQASNLILDGNGHTITGIILQGTSNATVKNLVVTSQGERFGMSLNDASNNLIINNTVSGFWSIQALNGISFAGIDVERGNSNTITQNNLIDNLFGMILIQTSNNLIVQNNISSNSDWSPYTTGIYFGESSDNSIYRNNFVNNHYQAQVSNSTNIWDNGYLGNYWSDYRAKYPNAAQIDDSGVYNIPYSIDEHNIDRHPLTQPFNTEFYAPKFPPIIAILSPVNQLFNESSVALHFSVDKQIDWMGYSLDGKDNVTVASNTTLAGLPNGVHTLVIYANDTFGNMGASQPASFTVDAPELFPIVPIAAAIIIAVAVATAGLLLYNRKRRKEAKQT